MRFSIIGFLCLVLSASNGIYAQLPNYVPSNGIIAWYPLDDDTKDYSGNKLDGTNNNTAKTTDRYGATDAQFHDIIEL